MSDLIIVENAKRHRWEVRHVAAIFGTDEEKAALPPAHRLDCVFNAPTLVECIDYLARVAAHG